MKIKTSIHIICKKCRIIRRRRHIRVICLNKRHKQRQS
uniref:Ribosomal protein n=1 Tax=Epipogium roseum TaxID=556037 RepID=A0A0B4N5P4_9ASPA|nr:ribosomal protein L36 [Epipogium roseum]AII40858.1 ribosomal protein L36 [Epipogium roseum]